MYGYYPAPPEPSAVIPQRTPLEIKKMYNELASILAQIEKAGERLDLFHDEMQMRIVGQTGAVSRSPKSPGYWEAQ